MRVQPSTLLMIHPMAPYLAKQMPDHQPNQPRIGNTSRFCKHKGGIWQEFDYKTLSYLGEVMSKKDMINLFISLVRECKGYGKNGGTRADVTAKRAFGALLKEGLIVIV
jgi:hypothetical protein